MTAVTHQSEDHRTDTPIEATVGMPAASRSLGISLPALVLLGLVIGALVGSLTSVFQAYTNGAEQSLFNAISPWLAPAFVVGAFARRPWHAAVAGVLVCLVELAAYDVTATLRGFPQGVSITVFWACGGVVGGALFGWAGRLWWRAGGWARGLGVALMSGAFLAEAGQYAFGLHYRGSAELFGGIGVALFVVLGLRGLDYVRATGWMFAVLPLGALGEVLVNASLLHVN
jgi:hypothetical protein